MQTTAQPRVFILIWLGQLVSIVGSAMTDFALGLYVYEHTGSVTQFAFVLLFRTVPVILLSPVAGALVDRWSKRTVMLCCDLTGAICSVTLAALFYSGRLQIEHIYIVACVVAIANSFQVPAYLTAITTLVPAKQLGRTNGLIQIAQACAEILSPLLAGIFLVSIHIQGVLLIDVASFAIALVTLLLARFPTIERSAQPAQPSLVREIRQGIRYIFERAGLTALLVLFAVIYFQGAVVSTMLQPLVLGFASAPVLGAILTAGGTGLLAGSLVLSAWGGPKSRINGILAFSFILGIGYMLLGLTPIPLIVGMGAFGAHFCFPFINGCNQAIRQETVPVALQGRVFAIRQMVARGAQPAAFLLAGPLADWLKSPAGNALVVGLGLGDGRGIALIFLIMGVLMMLTASAGWITSRRYLTPSHAASHAEPFTPSAH